MQKVFRVGAEATLSLRTHTGAVTIVGGNSHQVTVEVEMHGREKDVQDFEVTAEQTGDRIDVTGSLQTERSWIWYLPDLNVSYMVRVPRDCGVKLHTSLGSIAVRTVRGNLKAGTSEGNISISGVDGDIDLETLSGSIRADSCRGTIGMRTSCGGLMVVAMSGDVDATTGAGEVKILEVAGKVRAQTAGGTVALSVQGPNRGVHVESSGGDIDIVLPPSVAGTIDAEAAAGVVTCTLPGSVPRTTVGNGVDEKINGGGSLIYAHTVGGNVRIRPSGSLEPEDNH